MRRTGWARRSSRIRRSAASFTAEAPAPPDFPRRFVQLGLDRLKPAPLGTETAGNDRARRPKSSLCNVRPRLAPGDRASRGVLLPLPPLLGCARADRSCRAGVGTGPRPRRRRLAYARTGLTLGFSP